MENMKRAISAFMALVLVLGMLPGVPMFAGAEEVETQPETVAVETTAAVTVPEETEAPETTAAAATEAPETVPETTAAAEIVPEETVPETTAAQETVPQETVTEEPVSDETIPGETVSEETVPAETLEEVSAEAADANDTIVPVTKIEASAAKKRTYVGDDVQLTATITPTNATTTDVTWVVEEGSVNEVALQKGYLRANEAGTVVVHAEAADGSEVVSESIEVEFVNYKMEINEYDIAEENIYEDQYVLQTGNSMTLSVRYMTWTTDEESAKTERPLHTANPQWSLVGDSEKYATLTQNGTEATITAKLVTEYQYITVKVEEQVSDTLSFSDIITIRLYPNSYKLYITDEYGNDVTNGTIVMDTANEATEMSRILTAMIWPVEGDEDLVWSRSNSFVKLEDLDEDETANKSMKITADPLANETVITVQGAENSELSATVTIKMVRYLQDIAPSTASEKVQYDGLVEGKSVTLQAVAYEDREIVEDHSLLKWELAEGDEAYATISDKGVLKALSVDVGRVVTVKCSVVREDELEPASFELYIPIIPKATAVKILSDTFVVDNSPRSMTTGEVINGQTITVDTEEYVRAVPAFLVEPYADGYSGAGDEVGAKQEVTWKSSNTSVAAFDPLTDELVWRGKNGTTTITATATDGSGKSASVKLQFGTKLRALTIEGTEGMFLRSGSGWTFDLSCYPENATNTAVTWAVYAQDESGDFTASASAIATISSSGRLTAKTVYDNHMVRVVATSKEDPSICAYFDVLIRPKTDYSLTLLDDDGNCVTKTTILLDVGTSVSLEAVFVGEELGSYESAAATWTSSTSIVEGSDGYYEAVKVGSKTITATSQDGKKATVTIKVVSKVDEIEVYEKNDTHALASGKSLTLKADVIDYDTATEKKPNGTPSVSKVTWHIEEGGEQYATVTSGGKVTAVKGYDGEPVTIGVYAVATDGSGVVSNSYEIEICPVVESMRIDMDGLVQTSGTYTHYLQEIGESVGQLVAVTYPAYASDEVTWKSSNAKIADVDEDGYITAYKAGTVTITATASDGSGKKATFKLTIVSKIVSLTWNNDANELYSDAMFAIAGGKTLTLKPTFYGVDGKKITVPVEWDISKLSDNYGTAFVKKFSKGTLTTVAVTEAKYTEVTIKVPAAYAGWEGAVLDETEKYACVTVLVGVYPTTTSLQITENGKVVTNTLWRKVGCDSFQLDVEVNEGAATRWTWKSSNEKIATVDENGVVTYVNEDLKAATVTITATAKDGSGKKDSIKIQFAK